MLGISYRIEPGWIVVSGMARVQPAKLARGLADAVERLGVRRNPAYSPLVQVAFQLLDNASFNAGNLLQSGQFGAISGQRSARADHPQRHH